jgi:hypothetical protein
LSFEIIDVLLSVITNKDLCIAVRQMRVGAPFYVLRIDTASRFLAYVMGGKMSKALRRELSIAINENPTINCIPSERGKKVDYRVVVEKVYEKKGLKVDKRWFMEFLFPKGVRFLLP